MTIEELYQKINGDYAGVLSRLFKVSMVQKYVGRFLDDPSFGELQTAINAQNWADAFRAAHTMKGLSATLGLTPLQTAAETLTESLRGGVPPANLNELFQAVAESYAQTSAAIAEYRQNPS